jgi:Domain of unknown function (DUF389)
MSVIAFAPVNPAHRRSGTPTARSHHELECAELPRGNRRPLRRRARLTTPAACVSSRTPWKPGARVRLAPVINLEVFGQSATMSTVAQLLDGVDGVSRVRLVPAARAGHSVVSAAARPVAVDALLEALRRQGVPDAEITLTRVDVVGSLATGPRDASLVWADVLGTAWLNARPIASYLAFMFAAGVIACYGVIDTNVILIVGAMAVSPDLLPITAIGVGIVGRRPALAGRALLTLALGLAIASAAAAIFALAQDRLDLIRLGSTCRRPGCSEASRASTTKRSRSPWLPAWPACWRSRPAPARASAWLSRSRRSPPPPGCRGRSGRARDGYGRAGRARRERRDDGRGRGRHALTSGRAHATRSREAAERRRLSDDRFVADVSSIGRALAPPPLTDPRVTAGAVCSTIWQKRVRALPRPPDGLLCRPRRIAID